MPKYTPRVYSDAQKEFILKQYQLGIIPKAEIPMSIFVNDIKRLINLGIYWEEWDTVAYMNMFRQLERTNVNELITYKKGKKYLSWGNVSFVKLANVFMPQMWEAKSASLKSMCDVWHNEKRLGHLLMRFLKDKKIFTEKEKNMKFFRKWIRSLAGTYFTYNYKPDIAKIIYEKYGSMGKVYDFSMGWGGRLVGFLASNATEYVGVDVNHKNFESYDKIAKAYTKASATQKVMRFVESPAENFCPKDYRGYFDLAFSSPPYFIKEIYSDDANQHHLKHGTDYQTWLDGFLEPTVKNSYRMLKDGGHFVINIADVSIGDTYYPLDEDCFKMCSKYFQYVETLYMKLNKSPFTRGDESKYKRQDPLENYKWEKVFVFKKVIED